MRPIDADALIDETAREYVNFFGYEPTKLNIIDDLTTVAGNIAAEMSSRRDITEYSVARLLFDVRMLKIIYDESDDVTLAREKEIARIRKEEICKNLKK